MLSFFNQFSLRNKLLCILLAFMIIFSGFSLFLIRYIEDVSSLTNTIKDENIPEIIWLNHWEKKLEIKGQIVRNQVEHDFERDFHQRFELDDRINNTETLEEEIPVPSSLESLEKQIMLLDFTITNKVFGLLQYNNIEAAKNVVETEYLPELESLKQSIETKTHEEMQLLQQNTDTYPEIIEQSLYFLLIITILGIIISLTSSFKLSKSITNPIESMVTKVDNIANGDYGEKVTGTQQLELQSLVRSINQMSASLQQSFHRILEEKMRHEQILNSLPVGIITYDNDDEAYLTNSFARELLGLSNELISDSDIIAKETEYPILKLLISNESFHNKKIKVSIRNKEYVLLVSQSNLLDYDQVKTGKIFFFVDVTESTNLENRIVQSEKLALVGEMAASSAHEIRNPLTVVNGFLSLMKESMTKEEMEKYNFHLIMKELDRIYSVVEQMLLMSKHKKPEKEMILLRDLLDEFLPLVHCTLEAKDIKIQIDVIDEYILVDVKQFKQVLLNLMRNSREAIGHNGVINITSRIENGNYIIYFRDTGTGIPESIKNVLFEPFSTSKENGTGLGLNVVARIIENHVGNITVDSSDENGTTFKISLPIIGKEKPDN
ncbi:ATP-binding protein [Gracilibacillus sp. S3-1-1]|uniref:ATP-binding protein n=1 Tax=Gracilibacillus pellucidus TaxID=3095368 RepID=A0ACC6M585_9BACI|nr:ATP-binding protein [Gracilibacillus sp. S3-1-1]MDX8046053.1 ATP-binding protein [Gracilibacillus sp. S3-1-1]